MICTYERNKDGDKTMYHKPTNTWFAYATSVFKNGVYRGKGKTEKEAVQNSIKITQGIKDKSMIDLLRFAVYFALTLFGVAFWVSLGAILSLIF